MPLSLYKSSPLFVHFLSAKISRSRKGAKLNQEKLKLGFSGLGFVLKIYLLFKIMGRPPCCDKAGVKKGPWTPEEDIVLVSYIQEHGPGNWRGVPVNTGLLRCSKSCRLRWTNYLRPGIKRGNFTEQEEKMIIHLQALLGNRWAAIASYLPQRTDNDIKNYWNTHLKKKLSKLQDEPSTTVSPTTPTIGSFDDLHSGLTPDQPVTSRGQWERRVQTDINLARKALMDALSVDDGAPKVAAVPAQSSSCGSYASSAENIARLMEGWTSSSAKKPKREPVSYEHDRKSGSGFGFESFDSSNSGNLSPEEGSVLQGESVNGEGSLSLIEKWLFEEGMKFENDLDLF